MSVADFAGLAIKTSMIAIVFGLGLKATLADLTWLIKRPWLLLRSFAAMNIIMPILTVLLVEATDLKQPVKIALLLLSVSPVPPLLPRKQLLQGGEGSYIYGLLVTAALLSIVFVPVALTVLGAIFGREEHVPVAVIVKVVMATVLAPFIAGVLVRRLAPAIAARIELPVSRLGLVLLLVAAILVPVAFWTTVTALIGDGTIVAVIGVAVVGLLVGHLIGAPDFGERSVLAAACSARHPGVAIAAGAVLFPGRKDVVGAILLYVVVMFIVTIPYVVWCRRHLAAAAALGKHG